MKEKIAALELQVLRNELGELGGAGHYFGDDKAIEKGGPRDQGCAFGQKFSDFPTEARPETKK